MKKKIFALLLALCVAFTMMPAMALAAETTESDASSAPTMAAYKDSEGTEEIAGGIVDELDEFYMVYTYVPADGEVLNFYGNYGAVPGISVGETAFNSKGYPYAKVTVTGKFEKENPLVYWITIWRDPSTGFTEEELAGINVTVTKTTGSVDSEAVKSEVKSLLKKLDVGVKATKTSKGIKVKASLKYGGENAMVAVTSAGYTVKYQFLRSTSKTKNYKVVATKPSKTYVNTSAKKGTKYYYKCRVAVYDANGKLVAKTALSQSDVAAKKR